MKLMKQSGPSSMIQWRFASFFGLLAVLGARCPLPSPTTAGFLVQILSMFFSVLLVSLILTKETS